MLEPIPEVAKSVRDQWSLEHHGSRARSGRMRIGFDEDAESNGLRRTR